MANGVGPVLTLQGKTNSGNALVVTGDTSAGTTGGVNTAANCQGKVDSSNRLVVKFVV